MSSGESQSELLYRGFRSHIYETAKIVHADRLYLDDCAVIGDFAFLNASGMVSIGRFAHVGIQACIAGGGSLKLGDFSELSYGVVVITGTDELYGSHLFTPGVPAELRRVTRTPVEVGRLCLVGARSVVYPGSVIGEGVVIQPGTIVQGYLEPWRVYEGPTCRPTGNRPERETLLARADQAMHWLHDQRRALV